MLNAIIQFSLRHRGMVLLAAGLLLILGSFHASNLPLDVFPDVSAPTVTVVTEARGMAPEEVELLVTFPVESVLNGAPGVRRVRSVSAAGISVVWVEFGWGEDVYRTRQIVSERLQGAQLPASVDPPQLGPISSVMGEITFIALTSSTVSPMELRRLTETVVRRALLSVPGISQVVPIGGDVREYQVEADPIALAQRGITIDELIAALESASRSSAAGFHVDRGQEYLVRGLGRAQGAADLAATVLRTEDGAPVTVGDVAEVREGSEPKRGTASYKTRPAVILSIQKQPDANTLALTREIERLLAGLSRSLPEGVKIETENFRQADFIQVAIRNVAVALRDGAVLVVIVLLLFLGNLRTTLISALAIPLSLVAGVLVISLFGYNLNTMTLGGLTIAIGALVDDAIIDVENVFRRLRQERAKPEGERRSAFDVVFRASSEVRGAILFATLIIVLVFLPLFVLPGMEGRLLRPLGFAYVAALVASLLVSLTVTPVLCYLLLPRSAALDRPEPWLLRTLHHGYRPTLDWSLRHPAMVIAATLAATAAAVTVVFFLGRTFLPPFNEGSLTVSIVSPPGITLDEGDALGRQVEQALLDFPEVVSTSRRTGRAERDEHVQGVNASEMEVVLREGRPKEELLGEMRKAVATIPGAQVAFGQPISHRIDHMISGSKTNLAVKVFGPDLAVLRGLSGRAQSLLASVPGVVDISNQEQAGVPQLVIGFDRRALALHGLTPASLSRSVEALFQGAEAGEVVEGGVVSRVVVRLPERLRASREELEALPAPTPSGRTVRLGDVARPRFDLGPGLVRRENVERVAMITANITGADLTGTVERVRTAMESGLELPAGYRIAYGGQFEEAARSLRNLAALSGLVLIGMYGLLFFAFRSHRHALIVLVNLPLALVGGVFAVALGGGVLSVASLVGFITLFGIATRNGVLLVSHYQHLMREEGLPLAEAVVQGARERLAPVLMTALTAGLALIPLILAGSEPGNEIQSPMAQVILGGLLSSTFLNLVLVPVLFARWGGPTAASAPASDAPTHRRSVAPAA
ncbi:MAG TPA: efflux RND transporter permease subunit [Thermoanaerobaculia bacterium]|nr:efflux RND transporter permease subunit [Thermoanaerobaculia bacterium]